MFQKFPEPFIKDGGLKQVPETTMFLYLKVLLNSDERLRV
jgi:hypothetical protein